MKNRGSVPVSGGYSYCFSTFHARTPAAVLSSLPSLYKAIFRQTGFDRRSALFCFLHVFFDTRKKTVDNPFVLRYNTPVA